MPLQPALYKPHPPDRPRHILPNMLRHLVFLCFAALWISFAVAEASATTEPAKPVNIEPLKDDAKENSDDLETGASSWGGYYSGWGGNGRYGNSWNVRPWYGGGWGSNSGWGSNYGYGGRGYGGGWNGGWGWNNRGYGGWNGYRGGGGYWR